MANRSSVGSLRRGGLLVVLSFAVLILGVVGLVMLTKRAPSPEAEAGTQAESNVPPRVVKAVEIPTLPVLVRGEPSDRALAPAPTTRQALFAGDLAFDARIRKVQSLDATVGPVERRLLEDYLVDPHPDDGLSESERDALKNDILNVLRIQEPPVDGLATTLAKMVNDPVQSPVMRDYAIQHLSEMPAEGEDAARARENVFWQAAGERGQAFAGTALLGLARKIEAEAPDAPDFETRRDRLSQAARSLAADDSVPLATRATALNVAGRFHGDEALALAKHLAANETSPFLLTACLPILRTSGDAESLRVLEGLARTSDSRLRQQALQTLAQLSATNL